MTEMTAQAFRTTVLHYGSGSDHPDLEVYRRGLDYIDWNRFSWTIRHLARLGDFYGDKRLLEIGCGFGWDAVAMSMETGATVVAMDILPSMIDGVRQCLSASAAKGQHFRVEPLVADICDLRLPDASLDGIYSSEAVEHVHSLELMYERCFAMLKPGARLVIVNDSNAYNSGFRKRNLAMWEERDASHEHTEWLKREVRPVEHADAEPYAVMRERMVRETSPALDDRDVKRIVYATAGLTRPDIERATRRFVADGSLPTRPVWSWCRNPETGEYAERLLDPFAMADGLRAAGFKVTVQHLLRKFPFRLANNLGVPAIQRMIFERKPHFVLVARKPR